ncbi:hypothetical protein EW145_g3595 [Phellinidium pouzarii]|uniref:Ammonium transporter AmtB-like domain-containing protein n=1 Tax=Phellinidium pouzarii TaxID=167371 RepID=A0A4V3XCT6_9AGAM|nr:hypothetical protein EW145_g3595 [Phellinidium pouzarii]
MAIWNTMLAAAFGGVVWCLLDWRLEKKFTMVGFCSGTIAGLVAATPASGFIPPWAAVIMGIVSGAACNFATKLKFLMRIDDALDLFAEHAIGGMIGLLFNAFFAKNSIIALDNVNTSIPGGWLDHNWKQLYIQFAYICAASGYAFVMTALLAKLVDMTPCLHLRATDDAEHLGMDDDQIGEFANDYIEVRRDYDDWTPPASVEKSWNIRADSGSDSSMRLPQHVAAGDRHGKPDVGLHDQQNGLPASGQNGSQLEPISEKE